MTEREMPSEEERLRIMEAIHSGKMELREAPINVGASGDSATATPRMKPQWGLVEMLFHQGSDGQVHPVETRLAKELESDEQMWIRVSRVGPEWTKLETGWIEECTMLLIRNDEGGFQRMPTKEEKDEMAQQVIFVGQPPIGGDKQNVVLSWFIRPGESLRGSPVDLRHLFIRSGSGKPIRYTLALIPK
jgi:hypothetical protein